MKGFIKQIILFLFFRPRKIRPIKQKGAVA